MVNYYAVKAGRAPGLYKTWEEAETQVSGYSGAKHRRFPTLKSALDWVNIPIGQLAPWVQEALSEDTRQEGPPSPPPSSSIASSNSLGHGSEKRTRKAPTNTSVESLMGTLNLGQVHWEGAADPSLSLHSGVGRMACDIFYAERAAVKGGISERSPSLQTGQRSSEVPLSSTPCKHIAASTPADQDPGSPARNLQKSFSTRTDLKFAQPDYSIWSSTNHSGWFNDSLLSGIFHPPASGPLGSLSAISSSNANQSEAEVHIHEGEATMGQRDDDDIDPMLPSGTGLMGVADENTWNHRIHLRAASTSITHYTSGLRCVLGRHATNYLYMHYYSAGSAVAIANAYLDYLHDGESFTRLLVDRGMPPRHAAYMWTIISPEVALGPPAACTPYSSGDFDVEDDQDMSFIRSA